AKYNYFETTLMSQTSCPHCGKTFKVQGFKKHETSCKKQREDENEQEEFTHQYEAELCRGKCQILFITLLALIHNSMMM
ncbi:hypothetical protein PAXRUDRAFT_158520, partial [Paxillus rubicundulus Ve08.2h10]